MDFFSNVFINQGNNEHHHQQGQRPPIHTANHFLYQSGGLPFAAAAEVAMGTTTSQQQTGQRQGVPPASQRAIRRLPKIIVTREDLVDENNRECCICFDAHNLGDKVIRLPCAHIYHPCCITEWLAKHCTCPICRYELPTDDPSYEKERKIRMQKRRPRFARYELERMTMKSLIELCKKLKLDNAIIVASEKKDIIQSILESGRVECIVAPEPVEYQSIGILRGMSVGGLKRCMAKSGVFFYAKDVVEKEDMVQIFINSGRIVLTEEESIYGEEISEGYCRYFSSVSVPTCAREESQDFVGVKSNHAFQSASGLLSSEGTDQEVVNSVKFHPKVEKEVMEYTDIRENKKDAHKPKPEQNVIRSASEEGIKLSLTRNTVVAVGEETEGMTAYSPQVITSTAHNDYNNLSSHDFQSHGFNNTSVAGLREVAATLNLDLSDCIEKKEMADRILVAISRTSN